jgi:asparagine synthase (glutamine-hydrolysing)
MSGIAGIIRFDGAPVGADQIAKITGAMAPRGPDGIHHWTGGSVALGHCMLRTTPESQEEVQPLTNEDGTIVLVMDGRLDNREELKQELIRRGIAVRNRSDAELVLGAYELWHDDSPSHLLGDFAFAVWDARRQELFCARDHVGAKLFCYFSGETFLAFASDEEAFFDVPEVSREPNEDCIIEMLIPSFNGYDLDASCLKDIVTLQPGKSLCVRRTGQKVIRTYWQLEPEEESRFASDFECEEAFRSVFSEAVRRRIRTLGHPALMLSGGIDSAAVAGAAHTIQSQISGVELHTYSVVSDEATTCCETRNIQSIIKGYERQAHHVAVPSFAGIVTIDDLKEAVWTNAQPVANTMPLPAMMYLAASRDGHRVMLDGIDGDKTTYTPVRYVSNLLRSGAWREFWGECCQVRVNHTYLRHQSLPSIVCKSAWDVLAPSKVKRLKRAISSVFREKSMSSLINPDFAKDICLAGKLKDRQVRDQRGDAVSHQEQHIRALFPGIANAMAGFDRVAARYGIEARHPWSDKSLVEFYARLPLRYKARAGWTKYLVRKATAPWLDKDVRWNTEKDHLGRRLFRPLLNQSSQEIMRVVATADSTLGKYVDTRRLASLSHRCERAEGYELGELYYAMTLAFWLNRLKKGELFGGFQRFR